MGYYVEIHPDNPQQKQLEKVAKILRNGGVAIIPTDTVYALACDSSNNNALDKMSRIKGDNIGKTMFSFIFNDLSHLSQYTKPFDNATYKMLKRNLPGPFTFILEASIELQRVFKKKKKTVGIRVPDNNIARQLSLIMGNPLAVTSLVTNDDIIEYPTNAELIFEDYENIVDVVIDGGIGGLVGSSIVDLTSGVPEIIREGAGSVDDL